MELGVQEVFMTRVVMCVNYFLAPEPGARDYFKVNFTIMAMLSCHPPP